MYSDKQLVGVTSCYVAAGGKKPVKTLNLWQRL